MLCLGKYFLAKIFVFKVGKLRQLVMAGKQRSKETEKFKLVPYRVSTAENHTKCRTNICEQSFYKYKKNSERLVAMFRKLYMES